MALKHMRIGRILRDVEALTRQVRDLKKRDG